MNSVSALVVFAVAPRILCFAPRKEEEVPGGGRRQPGSGPRPACAPAAAPPRWIPCPTMDSSERR